MAANRLMGETKILTPITDEMAMPSSFNSMETPPEERNEHEEIEQQEVAKKKKKKNKLAIILISLLALALLIGGIFYFAGRGSSEVKIPNVEDKTEAEARKLLEDAGLKVKAETKEIPNDSIAEGKVVKTDPAIDSTVKKNREVELYISSGNKKIKLDDYSGEDYKDAIEALGKLGFKESQIKITKETDSKIDEDKVISQTPEEGVEVDPKTDEITLVVSKGPDDIYLADYASLGYSYSNAVDELLGYGIKESQINRVDKPSDTVAKDLVIAQNPAAGNPFNPKKGKITLTVSSGPDKTTTSSSESSTVVLGSYAESYTYENAVNALTNLGIKENQISKVDEASDLPKGTVISQDPGAGATFDLKNGRITLKVSTGPSNVSVPSVLGLSQAEAKSQIESSGLKYVQGSGDAAKGTVSSISPSVGDSVAKGTSVTVNFTSATDSTGNENN